MVNVGVLALQGSVEEHIHSLTIIKRAKEGMPIWGTCAGMILMANEIVNENYVHLG